MKNFTFIIICSFLLLSCSKKTATSTIGAKVTSSLDQHFIPNWHDKDTLIGMIADSSGSFLGYDTIYTKMNADTSFIIYKDIQYYIWTISLTDLSGSPIPFQTDLKTYSNCCINTIPFDTSGAISFKIYNSVFPSKYIQDGNYIHQQQEVIIQDNRIIKPSIGFVNGGVYTSNNTY